MQAERRRPDIRPEVHLLPQLFPVGYDAAVVAGQTALLQEELLHGQFLHEEGRREEVVKVVLWVVELHRYDTTMEREAGKGRNDWSGNGHKHYSNTAR